MNFGPATYGLGLLAGALSTLSPCVLPLVPVLVAAAVNVHRWGAMALGIGLALSFTIVGIFLATFGASLGLDPETFRTAGAVMLALFGVILLVPKLQDLFAQATSALGNSGNQLLARTSFDGLTGQFLVGTLLGVVWSLCVGPTLGAAMTLVLLGTMSRTSMLKVLGRLLSIGKYDKQVFGLVMLTLGVLIATRVDKSLEAWILDRTPDWLTAVTTKF